jgi:hypothetical protein
MTVPWKGSQLNKNKEKQQFNSLYREWKAKRLYIYYNELAGNTALEIYFIIIFLIWCDPNWKDEEETEATDRTCLSTMALFI